MWTCWTNLFTTRKKNVSFSRGFRRKLTFEKTTSQKELLKHFHSHLGCRVRKALVLMEPSGETAGPDGKLVFLPVNTSVGPDDGPFQGNLRSASELILWGEEEFREVNSGYGLQMKYTSLLLDKFWISGKTVNMLPQCPTCYKWAGIFLSNKRVLRARTDTDVFHLTMKSM